MGGGGWGGLGVQGCGSYLAIRSDLCGCLTS